MEGKFDEKFQVSALFGSDFIEGLQRGNQDGRSKASNQDETWRFPCLLISWKCLIPQSSVNDVIFCGFEWVQLRWNRESQYCRGFDCNFLDNLGENRANRSLLIAIQRELVRASSVITTWWFPLSRLHQQNSSRARLLLELLENISSSRRKLFVSQPAGNLKESRKFLLSRRRASEQFSFDKLSPRARAALKMTRMIKSN